MASRLFGTDGIRGRAGEYPIDDRTVYAIGEAIARQITREDPEPVLIGVDTRESSESIAGLLAAGLRSGGVSSSFAGIVPTPGVARATQHGEYSFGVMVSASHNPYHDNGIKVFGPFGYKLPDEKERAIERRVAATLSHSVQATPEELHPDPDPEFTYVEHLQRSVPLPPSASKLRVVLDCAHGAAAGLAPILLDQSGVDIRYIARDFNGRDINDGCGALHLDRVGQAVVDSGADLGAALDGDADRCLFVDELGNPFDGDNVLLAAATAMQRRNQLVDDLVVATVMSNLGLGKALQRKGIELRRTPVGDRHVIEEMLSSGAALGGEQSGHTVFGHLSTTGDGLLTLLMILQILAEEGVPCSEVGRRLQRYPQRLINVRVREKRPLSDLPEIRDAIAERELQLADRGRVVIRYSGTEPVVRIMVEAAREGDVNRHCIAIARLFEESLGE